MNIFSSSITDATWTAIKWLLHVATFGMVVYHCLANRREAAPTVAWIFVAWLFPVIGPLAYLAFGVDRVSDKGLKKHLADQKLMIARKARESSNLPLSAWRAGRNSLELKQPVHASAEIEKALDALVPDYPLLGGNSIEPLVSGDEAFPTMLEAIRRAKHHIHLQSFMFKNDKTGRLFLDALAEKANSGIKVRLLYDHFGSTYAVWGGLFRRYRGIANFSIEGWTQANILKRQFQINLRNHRKILVVDGIEAWCGGINIHDANHSINDHPAIRDYHFALRGPIVQELQYTFLKDWHFMTGEDADCILTEEYFPSVEPSGTASIRLINSGPSVSEMDAISDVFFLAITVARESVVVVTPYFVPPRDLIHALRSAALRGVDVKVIVPAKNNHFYAGMASRALYGDVLRAGVKIFERRPPFMHAKTMIIDNVFSIVGTANMDARSLRLNYETNLLVYDADFIQRMIRLANEEIDQSDEVLMEDWAARPAIQRMMENLCHLMMPVL